MEKCTFFNFLFITLHEAKNHDITKQTHIPKNSEGLSATLTTEGDYYALLRAIPITPRKHNAIAIYSNNYIFSLFRK